MANQSKALSSPNFQLRVKRAFSQNFTSVPDLVQVPAAPQICDNLLLPNPGVVSQFID